MSEYEGIEEHCKAQEEFRIKKALYKRAVIQEILLLVQNYSDNKETYALNLTCGWNKSATEKSKVATEESYQELVKYLESEL